MIEVDLNASERKQFGKGAARTLRREGLIPAIMYGPRTEPMALKMETKPFTQTLLKLQRQNAIITLNIKDNESPKTVILKEIQVDPVLNTLEHADFYEISLDSPITLSVPVKYTGKAAGVEAGGDLFISLNNVSLTGLPKDIPNFLEVDVTPLDINQNITCKDLTIPDNVTLGEEADQFCAGVTMYAQAEEELAEDLEENEEEKEESSETEKTD